MTIGVYIHVVRPQGRGVSGGRATIDRFIWLKDFEAARLQRPARSAPYKTSEFVT